MFDPVCQAKMDEEEEIEQYRAMPGLDQVRLLDRTNLGVLAVFTHTGIDGAQARLRWKAFTADNEVTGELRWTLKWFLPSLGCVEKESLPLSRQISYFFLTFEKEIVMHGFQKRDHIAGSRLSMLRDLDQTERFTNETDIGSEQDHWVSTPGLLVVLGFMATRKKQVEVKRRCRKILPTFLNEVAPVEATENLFEMCCPDDLLNLCDERIDVDVPCDCLQSFLDGFSPNGITPQEKLADKEVVC